MKILFLNFVCDWCPHFETELELMLDLMKKGNDVYSLACDKVFNKYCTLNKNTDGEICNQCRASYKKGLKTINFPKKNILKLAKIKLPSFPSFETSKELSRYCVDEINLGFGVYSSYMSTIRDYLFDPNEHKKALHGYLQTSYLVLKNVETIIEDLKPEAIYLFNGRFLEYWPVIGLCKKHKIDYYLHDRGADYTKYSLVKNDLIHNPKRYHREIDFFWEHAKEPQRSKTAKKWFEDRRSGIEQSWLVFTKEQKQNLLPKGFDSAKQNIAIFNSSLDEYYAFPEWQNPISDNENDIIKDILEHYKNDDTKHFYLRLHPNLKGIKTTQINQLKEIEKSEYKNLTIIWAEESIDTYSLIDASDKTITFSSTVGIEAAFWNKPSIVAGVSAYGGLDCCYQPKTYEELFNFIDQKLEPKDPKNSYPFGYWSATFGTEFVFFKPEGLFTGKFLGKNIRKRTLTHKIAREIRHPFKKAFKKILRKV